MNDHLENSEQPQEEVISPQLKDNPPQKKSTCKLSILPVVSFLLIIPLSILAIIDNERADDVLLQIFGIVAAFLLIGSPIIAIIAKIRIALSGGRSRGGALIDGIIIISSCLLFLSGVMPAIAKLGRIAQRVVCGTNLKGLSTAIHVYANEHDDQLPTASQWCDLLMIHADVYPKSFVCPSSEFVEGESCYAFNKHAAGKKLSELPADMVLLFETNLGKTSEEETRQPIKNRDNFEPMSDFFYSDDEEVYLNQWNQVGGPENLINSHYDGVNVAFVDGYGMYIDFDKSGSNLQNLRWDEAGTQYQLSDYLEVKRIYDERLEPYIKSVIALSVIVAFGGLIIMASTRVWRYASFALPVAIGASIMGLIAGFMGELLYQSSYLRGIGAWGSMGVSFLAGLCYVGILMKLRPRLKNKDSIIQFSVSLGMVVGIICSTILRSALLLIHRDSAGWGYMIAGFPFGIVGGAILGAISGTVCKYYRLKPIKENSEEGAL